jgi:hypothetical protein
VAWQHVPIREVAAWSGIGVGSVFRPERCRQCPHPQHPDPRWRSNVRWRWVWLGCDGVFRTERLWRFFGLGIVGSIQTHVGGATFGGFGVGLAVAACSDLISGSVVRYERWWRGLTWPVPAAFGLAIMVRIWAGVVSLFSTCLRGKWGKTIVMIRCFSNT